VCEGLSYRETADALALTYAEVNNAIHRARTALRSSLAAVVEVER
jgi:DNA-directed RNA polymerase specialized sigma24 family protein